MKTFLALALISAAVHAEPLRTADLPKLQDSSKREAEIARLTGNKPASYTLTQARFLKAPQKNGAPPLLVLCASHEYRSSIRSNLYGAYKIEKPEELFDIPTSSVPFRTEPDLDPVRDAELMIFDSKGNEIRPFAGNNYTTEGYYFDFDHDGILDRADSTNYAVTEAPDDSVSVFELKTIEANPRTLLEVIFNWHPDSANHENDWAFTCFDDNKDGITEIGFGPAAAIQPHEQRRFIFRLDAEAKRYSAGKIPEHSHIRVIQPGETLASIAKAGGLGYPVTGDRPEDDSEKAPPLISNQAPFVFGSFKDRPSSELAAFFQGKKRRDHFDEPEDSFTTRLPEKFWDLPAKQAALALAEANRTPAHREKRVLALDDRHGIAPPASGWILHDWGSSMCYSFSSHLFALHFGVQDPSLIVFGYNAIGAVGRNPWADQPMHNVRVIKLTEQDARFFADTLFWLDRIRTFSLRKSDRDGFSGSSSTADGSATLTLYSGETPREIASGTVWASDSISGKWEADYTQHVFINLAEFFIANGVPQKLGDRWNVAPDIDFQNLTTPTKERLTPRVDAKARQQLSESLAAILVQNARSPIPPQALLKLVYAAGDEALTDLLPALETLLAALPPVTEEDKEYAVLKERFERASIKDPFDNDETAEQKKTRARYNNLNEQREFVPAAILREPLIHAISLLRLAGNLADLVKAAAVDGQESRWALNLLHRTNPEEWATLMIRKFDKADKKFRNTLFETLAAGNPSAAERVIRNLSLADYQDLVLEITSYHREHDADALVKDIPFLMSLVKGHASDPYRRGQAISELASLPLKPDQLAEFIVLLLKEIKQPQRSEYGSGTRSSAILALTKVTGSAEHLELITTTPGIADDALEAGFEAIWQMAKDRPDRNRLLADFLRSRFTKSDGMMNRIFLYALAYDLRNLAPDIAAFATEGPGVQDGDAAEYSGGTFKGPVGQRYHIAREITALWSESDPATTARLWTFFVAAHPHSFNLQKNRSPYTERLTVLAANQIRNLAVPQRHETIDSALTLIPIPDHSIDTKTWLQSLGANKPN